MNRGRFVLTALVVWIVRVVLNATFYTKVDRRDSVVQVLRLTWARRLAGEKKWCSALSEPKYCGSVKGGSRLLRS
jgi:hypothetical protein